MQHTLKKLHDLRDHSAVVTQLEHTGHHLSRSEPISRRVFSFRLACVCGRDRKYVDTAGHIYIVAGVAFPPSLHSNCPIYFVHWAADLKYK